MTKIGRRQDEVVRITGARTGLTADVRGRQRRYVVSMLVRTVCVVLAVVLWNVNAVLGWTALAGAVLLPYIAVVIANAGRENAPRLPGAFVRQPTAPMLEAGGDRVGEGSRTEPGRPG